jgi:hypothetical protein
MNNGFHIFLLFTSRFFSNKLGVRAMLLNACRQNRIRFKPNPPLGHSDPDRPASWDKFP